VKAWLRAAGALVAAVVAVWLVLAALAPPVPSSDAPATAFSALRAYDHLLVIARAPRPPGSPGHAQARDHIVATLAELGLEPRVDARTWIERRWTSYEHGYPLRAARVENVVARVRGRAPGTAAILLVAHYDSQRVTPGASDDGYGVAALLEIARALAAGGAGPLERDVILLFTDAEEVGLMGAAAHVAGGGAEGVGAVLNVEARGNAGPSLMFETAGDDLALLRALAAAPRPTGSSLARSIYERMPNDTDFTRFREVGVPGLNFANIGGFSRYHAPTDTAAAADLGTLQHHGENLLAVTRRLAATPAAEVLVPPEGRGVYFDLLGRVLVVYPSGWSWLVTLAALAATIALAVAARRRRLLSPIGVGLALGTQLFTVVGVALVAVVGFSILRGARPGLFWPSARPVLVTVVAVGFAALGLAGAALARVLFGARATAADRGVAGLGLWVMVTLFLHQTLDGGTYVFAWPALLGALCGLGALRARPAWLAGVLVALAALPPLLLVAPLAMHVTAAFGAGAGPGVAVLAVLALAPLAPHVAALAPPPRALLPAVAGVAALALIAGAALASPFDDAYPRPDTLFLVVDADEGGARWASPDPAAPPWAPATLEARAPLPEVFTLRPGHAFWLAPADAGVAGASATAPSVRVLADATDERGRHLRVAIDAPGATIVAVTVPRGLRGATLDGQALELWRGGLHLHHFGAPGVLELDAEPGAALPVQLVVQHPGSAPGRGRGRMAKPSMVLPPHQDLMDSDQILTKRSFSL
jgi:hypothetical protein